MSDPYTQERRLADAAKFIADQAAKGSEFLERTQSRFVAVTYGITTEQVKAMKAKHRNELSFGEGK